MDWEILVVISFEKFILRRVNTSCGKASTLSGAFMEIVAVEFHLVLDMEYQKLGYEGDKEFD